MARAHLFAFPSRYRILATRVEVVLPTRLDWLAMLLMIGLFGFCAQVRDALFLVYGRESINLPVVQFLLTLGLQRETAGRGTMAVYVQVSTSLVLMMQSSAKLDNVAGGLCYGV